MVDSNSYELEDYIIMENNKFEIEDNGKSFMGHRSYKLRFIIGETTYEMVKDYQDIRLFFQKVNSEYPFLIFPYLYEKNEVSDDKNKREENIVYVMTLISKYKIIVNSEFFLSFKEKSSVNKIMMSRIINGKPCHLNISIMIHFWVKSTIQICFKHYLLVRKYMKSDNQNIGSLEKTINLYITKCNHIYSQFKESKNGYVINSFI